MAFDQQGDIGGLTSGIAMDSERLENCCFSAHDFERSRGEFPIIRRKGLSVKFRRLPQPIGVLEDSAEPPVLARIVPLGSVKKHL